MLIRRRIPTLTQDLRLYHMQRRSAARALTYERWRNRIDRLERWLRRILKLRT